MAQTPISRLRHDLRTPVNHIIGYSQLLLEEESQAAGVRSAAEETLVSGREIIQIIEAILPPSRQDPPDACYQELRSQLEPPSLKIQKLIQSLPEDLRQLQDFRNIFQATTRLLNLVNQGSAPASVTGVRDGSRDEKAQTASEHVLLVDDDAANRDVLARMLRRLNYRVSVAADGHQAIHLIDQNSYDLLLLDIMMPGVNGYDVLQHVKAKALTTPVIMISALGDMESVVRCVAMGAEDYFLKPFEPVLLRARISAVLDRKKCQDRLVAQQYLASLGGLTAGVAHELKNPLNFILNFAGLALETTEELDEKIATGAADVALLMEDLKKDLATIQQHGKRANDIIKNMLQHCQGEATQPELTDLNTLVAQYLKFSHFSFRDANPQFEAILETEYDPACGSVLCHPADLGRAIINLAGNAYDALREKKKTSPHFLPEIRVRTRNLNDGVEIAIRDNGNGIPAAIREKIFHPFFTTKTGNAGTGLGLSITNDIVARHKGCLSLDTADGQFTEFKIQIPRSLT